MTRKTHAGRRRREDEAARNLLAQRPRERFLVHLGRAAVLLSATFLLASCSLLGSSEPKGYDYSGTWRGSVTDATNGAGTFVATLDQSGYALSGTWHSVMADDATRQDGGAWSGQVYTGEAGDLLEVTLTPAASGRCSYKLTLSREQEAMSGDYAPTGGAAACVNLDRGTIQLTRP